MINVYYRGIYRVLISSISNQAINLLLLPVLSRFYSPEEFGVLGVITSASAIIVALCGLKYEQGILVSNTVNQAFNLLLISNFLNLIVNLIVLLIILNCIDNDGIYIYIPAISFFSFLSESLYLFFSRIKKFQVLANGKLVGTIHSNALKLALGFYHITGGLIIGQLIGVITPVIYIFSLQIRTLAAVFNKCIISIKKTAVRKICFPMYYLPQGILNVVSQNIPPVILAFYFSNHSIGLYWFCVRILQLPISVISDSIRQIITVKLASLRNRNDKFSKEWLVWTVLLIAISLIAVLFIQFFSGFLIPFIFGAQWSDAVYYTQWLVFYAISGLIMLPTVSALVVYKRLNVQLYFEVIQFILISIGVLVSIYLNDIEFFVVFFSMVRFSLALLFVAFYKIGIKND